ncbi:Ribosomal-protein-S5p-alanine acetyltransferase [plant metagenome]|uniref:Ribosomal-protein-S5p-alanine acetyltransferase n=1 Tax=plant metagenome TaxID=1297885 RepID=A0A484NWD5_9ZZZZ
MLETARLLLSPLTLEEDAAALFAIQSDPVVMRYWNHAPWTDTAQARDALVADQAAQAEGTLWKLGIRERETGRLVGTCMLFAIEAGSRRGEIGYNLAASAQGKGYMTEALEGFITHLFKEHGLRRLEAEIDPRNAASARLLQRLGFRQEGLLRERWIVEGEVSDSALYGLLAEDFRRARRRP